MLKMLFGDSAAEHRRALGPLLLPALALALAAVCAGTAASADITATGTVNAGALSLSSSASPSFAVTLDGGDDWPTYDLASTVEDSRGSGGGWRMTITSTRFSNGNDDDPHALADDASQIISVSATCVVGATCTDPSNSVAYPLTVPAGAVPPTAVSFFNGAADTGLGRFTVTPTVKVSVPANTYAGIYTSTISLTVAAGPGT